MEINDIKIADHFNLSEFQCPCCKRVMLHRKLLKFLIKLRSVIDEPIYINSGYRCKSYNAQVDGVPTSYHLLGMAADIEVKSESMDDLAVHADLVGITGIGVYSNFLHLDVRPHKERWEGRS